jgi:hypothetical protein
MGLMSANDIRGDVIEVRVESDEELLELARGACHWQAVHWGLHKSLQEDLVMMRSSSRQLKIYKINPQTNKPQTNLKGIK